MVAQKVVDNTFFKNAVEKLRELGKISLDKDLAAALGKDNTVISGIMNDRIPPSKDVLQKMVSVYGISLPYLKKGIEPIFIKEKELSRLTELLAASKELVRLKDELAATKEKVARTHESTRKEWQRWATDGILRNEAYLKALLIRVSEIHAHLNNLATDDVVSQSESDAEDIFLQLKKQLPAGL